MKCLLSIKKCKLESFGIEYNEKNNIISALIIALS